MKIALDMEGTLIAECCEFTCERTSYLAQLLLPCGIRIGARALLHDLARAGHSLTLYSPSGLPPWKLILWCRLAGLSVHRVITQKQHFTKDIKASALSYFGKNREITWPPCQGHDLIIDDEPRHIQLAWSQGIRGVLVTNREPNWSAHIREATLQSPEIEVLTQSQAT